MNDSTGKAFLNLKVSVYFPSLSPDLLPVTNVRKRLVKMGHFCLTSSHVLSNNLKGLFSEGRPGR